MSSYQPQSALSRANLLPEPLHTLLMTAAWFHDLGFSEKYTQNEVIGTRIAAEVLPEFGYNSDHIKQVRKIIMATKMPQQPQSLAGAILADADLDMLGRADFMTSADQLRAGGPRLAGKDLH
jgi:uncharacterized protein